jgi:hypothetical protein
MCWFILRVALCNHHEPQLLAGPFCTAIFQQLQRIQDPASWENTSASNGDLSTLVPFEWNPETCEPNINNTTVGTFHISPGVGAGQVFMTTD